MERKGPGAKVPGSERTRERIGQGAKVPGSELARVLLADSLRGANWPGSEKAVNLNNNDSSWQFAGMSFTQQCVKVHKTVITSKSCAAGS